MQVAKASQPRMAGSMAALARKEQGNRAHATDWHLWLGLPALEGRLLSSRPSQRQAAAVLCHALRQCGDQLLVLPATRAQHLRALAPAGPAALPLRRQGQPLPDAHEEAERSRGAAGAADGACCRTG